MTPGQADNWIITSAVIVGGTYAYMAFTDEQATLTKMPVSEFLTAWGCVYFIIALMAQAAPGLGAAFAILVLAADLLANAPTLAAAVKAAGVGTSSSSSSSGKGESIGRADQGAVTAVDGAAGAIVNQPASGITGVTGSVKA